MIDTTKLSKALRVGGAGIRAEANGTDGHHLYLPNNEMLWPALDFNIMYCRPAWVAQLRGSRSYQTWLARAKCEHEWPFPESGGDGSETCDICDARRDAVALDHYTLLPEEPADGVCAVPWCPESISAPGSCDSHSVLCSCHVKEWNDDPAPYERGDAYIPSVRAWAAKQTKGGDAASADVYRPATAGPGDEPGSVTMTSDHPSSYGGCESCGASANLAKWQADPEDESDFQLLCVYCKRRRENVDSAREDLDRGIRNRQDIATCFHDGYGVYSLPCEAK